MDGERIRSHRQIGGAQVNTQRGVCTCSDLRSSEVCQNTLRQAGNRKRGELRECGLRTRDSDYKCRTRCLLQRARSRGESNLKILGGPNCKRSGGGGGTG